MSATSPRQALRRLEQSHRRDFNSDKPLRVIDETSITGAPIDAINACKALPQERRTISCKVISYPNLMLELRNPCAREVVFDSDGLPLSDSPGHGLGVRSIAAFCQKYGALCQYEQQDGNFSLRILL